MAPGRAGRRANERQTSMSASTQPDAISILFGALTEKIDRLVDKVDQRFDGFREDMKDVRDRLTRIEAQDQPQKLAKLETDLKAAAQDIIRVEREAADELDRLEREFSADKLALEKRLTRMEIIIGPLTAGGSALLAAVVGTIVTMVAGQGS
ncbi:hypothetical protein [Brevundimonas sp.]|uniref:hypothetical protein n=1 Tax=Brevundimonas sp. TaxID=1871086 RepID=UPI0028A158DC|nr:hypothetical protein [Brevundimonas sp.]